MYPYYLLCLFSCSFWRRIWSQQRGRGGNRSQFCFVLFCDTNRWGRYAICFLCVCVFLTRLVSITRTPFQATINISGGSGAEDWTSAAGSTPAASAENPLDCNKYTDEGATDASAKVRHSLTLLVLFCLFFFPIALLWTCWHPFFCPGIRSTWFLENQVNPFLVPCISN